jgi:hypothetical protein
MGADDSDDMEGKLVGVFSWRRVKYFLGRVRGEQARAETLNLFCPGGAYQSSDVIGGRPELHLE